jgi:hypothetical protein
VFLLTDEKPKMLAGGPGLTIERSEAASPLLLSDLRSDKGMEWVPSSMWLTYMQLEAQGRELDYDLALSAPDALPALSDTGVDASEARPVEVHDSWAVWPLTLGAAALVVMLVVFGITERRGRAVPVVAA